MSQYREAGARDVVVAWDGLPVPELLGGAIVGSVFLLSAVTVVPQLASFVPREAGIVAGAVFGVALSWVWRPRRVVARAEKLTPDEQHVRRAA